MGFPSYIDRRPAHGNHLHYLQDRRADRYMIRLNDPASFTTNNLLLLLSNLFMRIIREKNITQKARSYDLREHPTAHFPLKSIQKIPPNKFD